MKLLKILFALLLIPALAMAATKTAEPAEKVLDRCVAKLNSAPSLTAKFILTSAGEKYPSIMTLSQSRYNLEMAGMKVWFDGLTQWTYLEDTKQLSITEPTADELLDSNPFALLSHWKKMYNCRRLKSGTPGSDEILLTPKNADTAPIRRATVTINSSTSLPAKLNVTMANGRTVTVAISSITIGKKLSQDTFKFNKATYKVLETIDLR